jgi:hypothetical protein
MTPNHILTTRFLIKGGLPTQPPYLASSALNSQSGTHDRFILAPSSLGSRPAALLTRSTAQVRSPFLQYRKAA